MIRPRQISEQVVLAAHPGEVRILGGGVGGRGLKDWHPDRTTAAATAAAAALHATSWFNPSSIRFASNISKAI